MINYRFATENDCGIILSFIKELAIYEKLENEVVANEKLLKEWLFEKKTAEVIFAMEDDKEVGYALFFNNFSTFLGRAGMYLEDLFVLKEYRHKGYGIGLIKALAEISVNRGYGRLEWACLKDNTPSLKFYHSLDAREMEEWTTFRLTGDTLINIAKK